ncbi:UBX domain protein [Candidatus Pelagibacter bacterium]|nr:UBX domain protein [Candidatus Pelagibacter bacterium]
MKKILGIIFSSLLYFNLSLADNSIEIKKFEKKNIEVLKFKVPDLKFPGKDDVIAQIHFPKKFDSKSLIIHQHGSSRDGMKFKKWGGKTDEWGTRLIKEALKRGYAVAVIDAFYERRLNPNDKKKFPNAVNIGLRLGEILSKDKRFDKSKIFYTGFSYGAGWILELQGEYYSKQKIFKAVVAAEPGCNANSIPTKNNFSTLIIKGEESHYYPIACESYLTMIKKVNNKVEYISIPKADHSFSSNRKTGSGKAFNGCSNNIILIYPDGIWKHMDGTLTSRKEAMTKCMTNESGGSSTREKLNEAITIALNYIDKNS